jgi:4-hydroxy-3-polyprenylbenzoate decarboxylase
VTVPTELERTGDFSQSFFQGQIDEDTGQPIPVVRGKKSDLLIPSNAELVIEGIIRLNSVKVEGPFGEFPGYYGRPEAGCPLVDITAVHYRSQPILTNALMADYPSCE